MLKDTLNRASFGVPDEARLPSCLPEFSWRGLVCFRKLGGQIQDRLTLEIDDLQHFRCEAIRDLVEARI